MTIRYDGDITLGRQKLLGVKVTVMKPVRINVGGPLGIFPELEETGPDRIIPGCAYRYRRTMS